MEALIQVATLGGPTMFARIGVTRALNRHVARPNLFFTTSGNIGCTGCVSRPL
jgi:hypothetical protein